MGAVGGGRWEGGRGAGAGWLKLGWTKKPGEFVSAAAGRLLLRMRGRDMAAGCARPISKATYIRVHVARESVFSRDHGEESANLTLQLRLYMLVRSKLEVYFVTRCYIGGWSWCSRGAIYHKLVEMNPDLSTISLSR